LSYMAEYVQKDPSALEVELRHLIERYNVQRDTYLFIYASALTKPNIPDIAMCKDDYYTFCDMLRGVDSKNIDVFIETPGGDVDAAEEIGNFLHSKFEKVAFVISGEAKSAGTILTLSGNEILMTNTGSLGPIDAQVRIGRSSASAYDYVKWVNDKRKEASKVGRLNPFDATMVAQISPGELCGVYHALKYAEDLVIAWLPKYKFANWKITKSQNTPVTEEMRVERAKEIAEKLTNHGDWRSHGRSIKIRDLEESVKLQADKIDDTPVLAEIVYRIHTVVRILFNKTTAYKLFVTKDGIFRKLAVSQDMVRQKVPRHQPSQVDVVEAEVICPRCNEKYLIYAKLINDTTIDADFRKKGAIPFPADNILKCRCGYEIDLSGVRNDIETQTGKKVIT